MRSFVLLADGQPVPPTSLPFGGEYEALLSAASPDFDFPEFDENTRAATFYTTGTTGDPKGVYYSHRDISLGRGCPFALPGTDSGLDIERLDDAGIALELRAH